jgi:hypothetical protein
MNAARKHHGAHEPHRPLVATGVTCIATGTGAAGQHGSAVAEDPPRAPTSDLPTFVQGRVLAQRFLIEEAVETTTRSTFYRAHDLEAERLVLLRISPRPPLAVVPGTGVQPFFVRHSQPLTGERILGTVGEGVLPGGWPLLVSQHWRGQSLQAWRRREQGRTSLLEALRMARHLALALDEAHRRGHAHGNLSTDDVWLWQRSGSIQTMLLGIGAQRSVGSDAEREQRDRMALGGLLSLLISLLPDGGLTAHEPPFDQDRARHALANVILMPLRRLSTRQLSPDARQRRSPADVASLLERLEAIALRLGAPE